jgi:hypothetical protein
MFELLYMLIVFITIIYYTRIPYPKFIIQQINEPLNRFLLYLFIYLISFYFKKLSLFLLILLLTIHLDVLNLIYI